MHATRAAALILLPTLTLAAVIIAGSAEPLKAAASALPTASAAGIMVHQTVSSHGNGLPSLAFQGTSSRTRLAIVVDSPKGGIIGFDRASSQVTTFEDSTGKTLGSTTSPFGPFAFGERIVMDGERLVLEIASDQAPDEQATKVKAAGFIDLYLAQERRVFEGDSAPLAEGQILSAGPFHATVKSYGKSTWNTGYDLEVTTNSPLSPITEVSAVLLDGTRVPLDTRSTMNLKGRTLVTFGCDVDLGTSTALEVKAWHNPMTHRVPFEVQARVGLE